MEIKCDRSDFEHGMIVGARWAEVFLKLLISWDLRAHQSLKFTQDGTKNIQGAAITSNALLFREVNVKWPDRLEQTEKLQ